MSQGFASGSLGCSNDCLSFDTSQCVAHVCDLTSASWSKTTANVGDSVGLNVVGAGCAGENVSYEVWENKAWWFDSQVMSSATVGSTSWTADAEGIYYFKATAENGDSVTSDRGNDLNVSVRVVPVGNWTPPIGIPRPSFGIEESYRMYDDVAKRNPNLTYYNNSEGGVYTHYVDNTRCDNRNQQGTYDYPLCRIPDPIRDGGVPLYIEAGSVVEIHGGPYVGAGSSWIRLYGLGTQNRPIFIRGHSETNKPLFTGYGYGGLRVGGTYMIIENLEIEASDFNFNRQIPGADHHVSIRNIEGHGRNAGMHAIGASSTNTVSHIVFYNNYIHDTAVDIKGDTDTPSGDVIFNVGSYANHIWIVDNHAEGSGADSLHSGHGATELHHIYIG
ncbi:MAG: hypothetical protein QF535_09810, partial [Anaerolineales bacterium]|nr:hypothetical protein [Anaerolineales bacterium]